MPLQNHLQQQSMNQIASMGSMQDPQHQMGMMMPPQHPFISTLDPYFSMAVPPAPPSGSHMANIQAQLQIQQLIQSLYL